MAKNGSHFENFWCCLQVFVLCGLAGMQTVIGFGSCEVRCLIRANVENHVYARKRISGIPKFLLQIKQQHTWGRIMSKKRHRLVR